MSKFKGMYEEAIAFAKNYMKKNPNGFV